MSQNIDTAEGKQKMFEMAKQMKEERKDVISARYVKDEHGNITVEEADIMQRWKRYFSEPLNEEDLYELEDHLKVEGPILGMTEREVQEALQKMKRGKAPGPSGVITNLKGIQRKYRQQQPCWVQQGCLFNYTLQLHYESESEYGKGEGSSPPTLPSGRGWQEKMSEKHHAVRNTDMEFQKES